ncbi:MAG: PorT family protein [Bacteroidales bacterium]|jgi:hypothetical protein|nr:PorT family protein [Bacteroidales bacterium]
MNARLIILGIFLLSGLSLHSQYIRHYLTAGVGTGMFSFNYNIEGGKSKPRLGFAGKASYCFYFSPNWGVGGGFDVSMYSTNGYLDGAKVSFDNKIDDEEDVYRKDIYFRDWSEIQTAIYVELPIELHYQYDFGLRKRRMMHLHFGAKVQLPLMGQYNVTRGNLETQGYYPEWNINFFDMPNHGFGTDGSRRTAGKLNLPLNIAATVGFDFLFEITKKLDIFAGGSFDYGFISAKSSNNGDLLYEDESGNLQYRGITASSAIDKMNTLAVRGEIGIRCALGKEYRPKLSYRRR